MLSPIAESLNPLVKLSQEYQSEFNHCPVGDLNYRLFYLPPPAPPLPDEGRIKPLIDQINCKLLTPTIEQLGLIQTIVLIAGGKVKVPAIKHLLKNNFPVSVLATDKESAKELLK